MYDVVVVGARCAGSPTALLLARKGYKVLLLDKASFPSDTISTHFVHAPGIAKLKRWGLLDKVIASNCPPVDSYCLDFGLFSLTGYPPPIDGVATAYGPRRTVLDKILVDAAVEAGAELREQFIVEEVCFDNNRVTGVRGRSKNSTSITEKARLVVGADGLHSAIARLVDAPMMLAKPAVACWYYSYWSGVPVERVELYPRDLRTIVVWPTNDGLTGVIMAWPQDEFHLVRRDTEGYFKKTFELAPGLAERIRAGKREARFAGRGDLPHFFRKSCGPGWALVGDAGHHKDPSMAFGISDAFRYAELLVEAIDQGLSGRRPLDEALEEYERQRNQAAMPSFEMNFQLATLQPPPPEMQALFSALRGNQTETDRLVGAMVGTVPIPEFFAPDNVQRIVSAAAGTGLRA